MIHEERFVKNNSIYRKIHARWLKKICHASWDAGKALAPWLLAAFLISSGMRRVGRYGLC